MVNLDKIYDLGIQYGIRVLMAIITLLIGLWIIKMMMKGIRRSMEKGNLDLTLRKFLLTILNIALKVMLVITVISMVGIEMTSFVAVLAAAGFAIGMALTGSLQNFAGGVMIVLFKPFKVGDFIEAQGFIGTVSEIQIFNTILKTLDNKTVIIPNGGLSNSAMTNYSTEPLRRVDFDFGIGYSEDIDKSKLLINQLIEADQRILKEPASFVAIGDLSANGVRITVRVWVQSENYWAVFFDMNEKVKKSFDKNGISFPLPHRVVRMTQG